jgi:glycosyltransferase involved in cell wall biosynthesis
LPWPRKLISRQNLTDRFLAIRILFASDSIRASLTGVGRMSLSLLRGLRALGHEVVPVDSEQNAIAGPGIVIANRWPFAKTLSWHFSLLRRLRAEVSPLLVPSGWPLVLGEHPRLAVIVHDVSALDRGVYRPGKHAWFSMTWARSLRKARLLVCASAHTRAQLLARVAVPAERCVVVPNALDADLGGRLREAGDARPDGARAGFLFVGTLERRKNLLRLLDAFAAARAAGVDSTLTLAGRPGFGSQAILARVGRPDLAGVVTLETAADDGRIVELYASAKALLFPSLDEGFGLPILEAMAARTPVLTSDCAAMPEVAGDAALLVDPTDTGAIRDAIVRLDREPGLRADLVARGRGRLARFEASGVASQLAGHLEAIA